MKLLTAYEVSQHLRIPLNTVYYLTKTGILKSVRIGKHLRYQLSDLENIIYQSSICNKSSERCHSHHEIENRRRNPRLNVCFLCNGFHALHNIKFECFVDNISSAGALLKFKNENKTENEKILRPDDALLLTFQIEEGNVKGGHLTVYSRIVRVLNNQKVLIGVTFRKINKTTKDFLEDYIGA